MRCRRLHASSSVVAGSCASISGTLLPERVFLRYMPELENGSRTLAGVPVRAHFTCPDSRTIVMTITHGEGAGSVVETHATPLGVDAEGRSLTMITEATIAYSDRKGFKIANLAAPLLIPMIKRTARQLWVDDRDYAERRYELRRRGEFPG